MKSPVRMHGVLLLAGFAVFGLGDPAVADTCAPNAVMARGEESHFMWSAKAKTRANWRAKIRAMPNLGPDYANWARAQDTEERCLSGPSGTVCTFTGRPCRP
jgi:hypothetical protein